MFYIIRNTAIQRCEKFNAISYVYYWVLTLYLIINAKIASTFKFHHCPCWRTEYFLCFLSVLQQYWCIVAQQHGVDLCTDKHSFEEQVHILTQTLHNPNLRKYVYLIGIFTLNYCKVMITNIAILSPHTHQLNKLRLLPFWM